MTTVRHGRPFFYTFDLYFHLLLGKLYDKLAEDVRFTEGLKACLNCGTCTAICPAAEFYNYQPRQIVDILQTRDDEQIEAHANVLVSGQVLERKPDLLGGELSEKLAIAIGFRMLPHFEKEVESEKGRQQLAIKRTVGEWILKYGYCLYPSEILPGMHPEQGPIWEWEHENMDAVMHRLGANYKKTGPGILRKIPQEDLDEVQRIFDETGGTARFREIEEFSRIKAKEMKINLTEGLDNDYIRHIYTANDKDHTKDA